MKPKKLFKAEVPELEDYIGRTVVIDGQKIKIESIVGNIGMVLGRAPKDQRPQFYEINGSHRISMLRFHAQMTGATDITEEQFKQFEEMEFWSEKVDEKNSKTAEQLVDDIMKKSKE
jgi:hypothetical protein